MSLYPLLAALFLVLAWALSTAGALLDARSMAAEPPEAFRGLLDADKYATLARYNRARLGLSAAAETWETALILAFLLAGGFNALDLALRSVDLLSALGPIALGLAYFAVLGLALDLAGLPFAAIHTFVLEERFGFNRTTVATFIADKLKAWLLAALLGGGLLAAILALLAWAGPWAWLWCWAVGAGFSLLLAYVAPAWILPLFNTFTPLEDGELRTRLEAYAAAQGFELSGIFVIDGSRRSSKSNAYFTGFGKKRRIALFDTLVERHDPEALTAVLAHEVGHARLGHIRTRLVLGILRMGVVFLLLSLFLDHPEVQRGFGMVHPGIHAGLVFFALLYAPLSLLLGVGANALSRRHEYQADRFAARTTGAPEALVRALKTLAADNMSNLTPHPFNVALTHSHPPVIDRIRALEAMDAAC